VSEASDVSVSGVRNVDVSVRCEMCDVSCEMLVTGVRNVDVSVRCEMCDVSCEMLVTGVRNVDDSVMRAECMRCMCGDALTEVYSKWIFLAVLFCQGMVTEHPFSHRAKKVRSQC